MSGAKLRLPYGRQLIEDDDVEAVVRVLRGDHLTTGPDVERFESALAEAVGASHAVSCGNGTQALHLAAIACGIGPGDWAVVPAVTFLATANAIRMVGAEVVFADVDPDTGLTTGELIAEAAARAPGPVRAVLPVHLTGRACDLPSIHAMARAKGWHVLDDACHALGTRVTDQHGAWQVGDGKWSDASAFSFHPVKTVAVGEGGAVTTQDAQFASRMRSARSHGMRRDPASWTRSDLAVAPDGTPNPWYYEMHEVGFNYRLPDLACALGASQLAKLERFVDRRAALVAEYDRHLADLSPLVRRVATPNTQKPGWHLCSVLIDFEAAGADRATVMRRLLDSGVGSQVHYIPVPWQPYYRERYGDTGLPGASAYYARTLSLPLFPSMTDGDVAHVMRALKAALQG